MGADEWVQILPFLKVSYPFWRFFVSDDCMVQTKVKNWAIKLLRVDLETYNLKSCQA